MLRNMRKVVDHMRDSTSIENFSYFKFELQLDFNNEYAVFELKNPLEKVSGGNLYEKEKRRLIFFIKMQFQEDTADFLMV